MIGLLFNYRAMAAGHGSFLVLKKSGDDIDAFTGFSFILYYFPPRSRRLQLT